MRNPAPEITYLKNCNFDKIFILMKILNDLFCEIYLTLQSSILPAGNVVSVVGDEGLFCSTFSKIASLPSILLTNLRMWCR